MRGLFKLEGARIWSSGLITLGLLMMVSTFVLNRFGVGRTNPSPQFEIGILFLLFGLGVAFLVVGITVRKVCACISHMMQSYDDELHKKLNGNADKATL